MCGYSVSKLCAGVRFWQHKKVNAKKDAQMPKIEVDKFLPLSHHSTPPSRSTPTPNPTPSLKAAWQTLLNGLRVNMREKTRCAIVQKPTTEQPPNDTTISWLSLSPYSYFFKKSVWNFPYLSINSSVSLASTVVLKKQAPVSFSVSFPNPLPGTTQIPVLSSISKQ